MESVDEEGQHVDAEAVLGAVQIQLAVGDEQHSDLPGEEHENQEPQGRNAQGNFGGQPVGVPDPGVVARAEIEAVDGLDGGGNPHEHGVGDLIDLDHHAVDGQGDIAAVDRDGAVLAQEVIQGDLDQGGHGLGQQAGKAQGENLPRQGGGGPEGLPPDPDRAHPPQVPQAHAAGGRLPDHGGDAGAHHAHVQREDEDGVQNQVHHRAQNHALHGVLGGAVRPDDGGEGRTHQLERDAHADGPQVCHRLGIGGLRGAAEHHDPGGQKPAQQRGGHAGAQDQRQGVADGPVRLLLLAAAQAQAHVGRAAVAQQQGECVDQDDDGKGNIGGGHAGDAHALSHEDLVHDVIEIVDHQRQGGWDGIAQQQCGDRLRLQGIGFLFRVHCNSSLCAFLLPRGERVKKQPISPSGRTAILTVDPFERRADFLLPSRPDCWPRDCTGLAERSRALTASRDYSRFRRKGTMFDCWLHCSRSAGACQSAERDSWPARSAVETESFFTSPLSKEMTATSPLRLARVPGPKVLCTTRRPGR